MKTSPLIWLVKHLYTGDFAQIRRDWEQWLQHDGLTTIFTPNPEQAVLAHSDTEFLSYLKKAQVLLPDGYGLVLARRALLTDQHLATRLAGVEVVEWWLREGSHGKVRTLLLGGHSDVAANVAARFDLTKEWCSGVAGYRDVKQPESAEEKALEELFKTWKPKVVFVAFGAPYQEKWIVDHQQMLEKNGVHVAMVCGGALDFLSGKVPRAPRWMQDMGFEWAYRLVQEPWRWRRQAKLLTFVSLVLQELLQHGRRVQSD